MQAGRKFPIQRGAKQDDVLSPALFNAGLELALARWKCNLSQHGLHVGGTERLTNIRYADDILLFAKSLEELVFMMESLVHELAHIGPGTNSIDIAVSWSTSMCPSNFA